MPLSNITGLADSAKFNYADSVKTKLSTIGDQLVSDPDKVLQEIIRDGIDFGLKIVAALIIYSVGAWLIRRVKHFLGKLYERKKTEKTLATFITSLTTISLTILLVVITISTLGVNTTSIAALLAAGGMAIGMALSGTVQNFAGGMAIGMALSGTVQNFAGGIMLLMFKPFKTGDYIEALGYSGIVTEMNIVSTKLRTFSNHIIILPNGALSNGNIKNFFSDKLHRLEWYVTVDYSTDNAKAKEVMLALMKKDKRILDSSTEGASEPFVSINSLKDSYVEYVMRAWVLSKDYWDVLYDMNEAIFTELPKNGIQFPFPQMDVHIKS